MLSRYFAARFPRRISGVRMNSTITGESGRIYTNATLLERHHQDSKLDIYKVESEDQSFVYKRASKSFFELSQRLATTFSSSSRLRVHVDCNINESILIYPYYRETLLTLLQRDPEFPPNERVKIMRGVGEAVQELHSNDWIHSDIKPDNILVNWTSDSKGDKVVTDVALGDFDFACELKEREIRLGSHAVGNVMWRSPEAHTGMSSRESDIYSLGLVYLYTLGAGDFLLLNNYEEIVKAGATAEQEILSRHFCYFGPVPESLYQYIKDERWRKGLRIAADISDKEVVDRPAIRLTVWAAQLGQPAVELLSGMTNLDPNARLKIEQVLAHRYWLGEDD